ncbi:SGNH/GDSL hydrolase family protein [Undibacterium jejuense]|uniref:SGNH/GDSL hydrolase family protein n=1 Tax=Undibacterium jejuense TaxID=1344949 RepID=A0A923HNC9_9BURK|nr:SGNH/GDSL hydrolase family protein [Undibacterium jejuense]MBC3861803.1 SGNH/GDSL hydrolase family protein [Undibacterium jejuense]
MSALLAGLTVLIIGDSHMSTPDYLITTLHDDLMNKGAVVYSFGACGVAAGEWMVKTQSSCGGAERIKDGPVEVKSGQDAMTRPFNELVKTYKPNLVVVVNADTMASYNQPELQKNWIWQQVSRLTKGIKKNEVSCVWVGPAWGTEGGKFGKTYARAKEMSGYLSEIVSPCTYVDSLSFSQPGEWGTIDGQHFDGAGYKSWGSAIGNFISSPTVLKTIKH